MVDFVPDNQYILPQTPNDPSQQLHEASISKDLSLADKLALQGQLTAAFYYYSKAFKLCPSYSPEVLKCLAESLSVSYSNRNILAHMSMEKTKLFRYVTKFIYLFDYKEEKKNAYVGLNIILENT